MLSRKFDVEPEPRMEGSRPPKTPVRNGPEALYDAIGGMDGCRRLSRLFHARVAGHPVLKAIFPRNLDRTTEHLALFIAERTGGPADYTRIRGKQSLSCRHAHVPIGTADVEAWLGEMSAAMEEAGFTRSARELLHGYFSETAGTVSDSLLLLHHIPLDELRSRLEQEPALARPSDEGRTLLTEAAGRWDVDRVRMLLENGSDAGYRGRLGHDALHRAAGALDPRRGEDGRAIVDLLVRHGADVSGSGGPGNITPLHAAARRGNVHIGEMLLDSGANIEAKDIKGESPLRRAVNCKQPSFVLLLLTRGADPLSQDKKGQTPLVAAAPGPIREALVQAVEQRVFVR